METVVGLSTAMTLPGLQIEDGLPLDLHQWGILAVFCNGKVRNDDAEADVRVAV